MDSPLVSVLVAAYNAEPWIAETLASVTGQTHANTELVVVDDGSTDGTLALARQFEGPRVRVIAQDNQGACAARNRAFAEAQGDVIQFLDADDVLHPEKIERQVRRLAEAPAASVAVGPWVRFSGSAADADRSWRGPDWQDYEPATDWLVQAWEGRGTMPTVVWLTPRGLVEAAGPWNETLLRNQDGEFFTRVVVHAQKLLFAEDAWSFYRSSGAGSVSARSGEDALRSLYDATVLCEAALLRRLDTPQTRRACSGLWQQFLFTAYPLIPALTRYAEARIEELGGMYQTPGVSRPLRVVRDVIGWKPALRLHRAYHRLRHS